MVELKVRKPISYTKEDIYCGLTIASFATKNLSKEVKEMSKHFVTEWTVSKPKHGKISL